MLPLSFDEGGLLVIIPVIWVWRYDCHAGRIVVGAIKFAPGKT